jgi:UDP-N-acetylglucosamine 4,6-dehydratase
MRTFITGGAGFLGRALLESLRDEEVTVYSRDEAKHARARAQFPDIQFIIGDILDRDRLQAAMSGHDQVIHAAAMKYVPQAETNVREAVRVNIDGSRNVFDAALQNSVTRVVAISTDKACSPVNVYGFTKKIMERLAQEYNTYSGTAFNTVRYGNVMASTGSVIPLFRNQARSRKLTLTDPTMTRFWLTIDQAVDLVNHSLERQTPGTILITRMPATDMMTIAKAAARMELGAEYFEDRMDIEIIGHRFGEKRHEELVAREEVLHTTRGTGPHVEIHPIFRPGLPPDEVDPMREYYTSATPDHWLSEDEAYEMMMKMEMPW